MKNIKKISFVIVLIVSSISMYASTCKINFINDEKQNLITGFTKEEKQKLITLQMKHPELFTIDKHQQPKLVTTEEQQKIPVINASTAQSSLQPSSDSRATTSSNQSYKLQPVASLSDETLSQSRITTELFPIEKHQQPKLVATEEQQKISYPTTPCSLYTTESNSNSGRTTCSNESYKAASSTSLSDETLSQSRITTDTDLQEKPVRAEHSIEKTTKGISKKIVNKRLHPSSKSEILQGLSQQTQQEIKLKQELTIAQKELTIMQQCFTEKQKETDHLQTAATAGSMVALCCAVGWLTTYNIKNRN